MPHKPVNVACSVLLVTTLAFIGPRHGVSQTTNVTAAAAASPAASPAGLPYNLDTLPSAESLFWAHRKYQESALANLTAGGPLPAAVMVTMEEWAGWGNRVPSIVTAYMMAVFTGRLFMFTPSTVLQMPKYMQFALPCEWKDYKEQYAKASTCSVSHFPNLADKDLRFCGSAADVSSPPSNATVITFLSPDYDLPLLQVNPAFEELFATFFPDGEVFHAVTKFLMRPKQIVMDAMLPYLHLAQDCIVGMHMRHIKRAFALEVQSTHFAGVARALARKEKGNVYVAADVDHFDAMAKAIPDRHVWWSEMTKAEVAKPKEAGNPGSELSAIVDILLLGRCKHIIVTPSSSFGTMAAGFSGKKPVFATYGYHETPFLNTWFWQSITSEPCFWKAGKQLMEKLGPALELLKTKHPLWMYHNQCHP